MNEDQSETESNPEVTVEDVASTEASEANPLADLEARLARVEEELETARQDTLYAHAETQNVRRRMEKELADARAYSATGFARDMLSVADNLGRALDSIPNELREDEKFKSLVIGLEATGRELDSIFRKNGIERIAALGLPLDPNQHQAMVEIPSDEEPGTVVQEMQSG